MTTTNITALALRLGVLLGTTAFFATSPVTVRIDGASPMPQFANSVALASDSGSGGGDDHGGDDHGGDDHGGDDHSGPGGGDDHGDDSGDDGSDDSSDDGSDDSSLGGGTGGTNGGTTTAGPGQVTKIETSSSGIEVTFADGSKEEIESGRYERKDSSGRTVEERPATQADFDRLSALF